LTDCGFCRSFAVGFRACGASAKTGKGRSPSADGLRSQTHHKPTASRRAGPWLPSGRKALKQ
jgi:hypothetical protein